MKRPTTDELAKVAARLGGLIRVAARLDEASPDSTIIDRVEAEASDASQRPSPKRRASAGAAERPSQLDGETLGAIRAVHASCAKGSADETRRAVEVLGDDSDLRTKLLNLCIAEEAAECAVASSKTALHVASESGHGEIVLLLLREGCDPAIRDGKGRLAYVCANSKAARDAFRVFRGERPDMHDYGAAAIPDAITADSEAEKRKKAKLKRQRQRRAKKQRDAQLKLKKKEDFEREKKEEEKKKEEEARTSRCSFCRGALPAKRGDVFRALGNLYCCAGCTQKHRRALAAAAAERRMAPSS